MATKAPAKPAPKPAEPVAPVDPSVDVASAQLAKYLKKTEADHYSLTKPVDKYRVSTGSLNLDQEMAGGFTEGAHRIAGSPQTGKTPFLLNVIDNFLDTVPNSRVVWCKAEGRLSEQNAARVRHPIVYDPTEWKTGTIFVHRCNIYENWIDMMRDCVGNNPTNIRYGFVTDSLDNMGLKGDRDKPTDTGTKVAGAPLLTKQMFTKMGLALNERGHYAFFISQASADIKIDPYAKTIPRQTNGAGGNSVGHNANETLEFQEWYEGDLILTNPDERHDRLKNRAVGHNVRIKLKKSNTENRYVTVEIPIKHGQKKGESAIWKEREVSDQLLTWQLISKAGSWMRLTETLRKELADNGFTDIPEQVQGINKVYDLLSSRPDVTTYLFERFKKMVSSS